MSLFMKIDGIEGESKVDGYEKQLELTSMSNGVAVAVSSVVHGHERTHDLPNFTEMSFTKVSDKASPKLFEAAFKAEVLKTIKVTQCREDKGKILAQVEYELHEPIITNYSTSSGGETPMETFGINFTGIKMTWVVQKEGGGKEGNVAVEWSPKTAKAKAG